jgi:hypothetical protein
VHTVALFARHRAARKWVDPQAYAATHRELIARCKAVAETANEVEAAFYRYMEDLAQPWLDPGTLARADRDIAVDLLMRCREVERQLGGRRFFCSPPLAWTPVGVTALIFAITLVTSRNARVLLSGPMGYARGWVDDIVFRVTHSTDTERLFSVACILVAVSIYSVSRTARS